MDKIDAKLKTKKRAREEPTVDRKYRTLLNDARVDALLDHLRPVLRCDHATSGTKTH